MTEETTTGAKTVGQTKRHWTSTEKASYYQRWKTSGLSLRAFCSQQKIAPSSFYHWVRKTGRPPKTKTFIPVNTNKALSLPAAKVPDIEIRIPNGIHCRFSHVTDVILMRELIKELVDVIDDPKQ